MLHTFLFSRAYFCDMGSYQIMSDVENPNITSTCVVLLEDWFTSWQSACAFVNKILVKLSVS